MENENHCGKFDCPAADRLERVLTNRKLLDEINRDLDRAGRDAKVWDKFLAAMIRWPA